MKEQRLAPNETIQLHDLLTLKTLCLTKSITMSPLVSDAELKAIIKDDIKTSQNHLKELRGFLEQSKIAVPTQAE